MAQLSTLSGGSLAAETSFGAGTRPSRCIQDVPYPRSVRPPAGRGSRSVNARAAGREFAIFVVHSRAVSIRLSTIALPTLVLLLGACPAQLSTTEDSRHEDKARSPAPPKPAAAPKVVKMSPEGQTQAAADKSKPPEPPRDRPPANKGDIARPGMTPEEIAAYATEQGDPKKGVFHLEDAFAEASELADKAKGVLTARFNTTMGEFDCELYEDKTPNTVANFVGLARGVRPSRGGTSPTWETKKFYDGILFHRVIAGFMIQTGDPTGTGMGGPGYVIEDEFDASLVHEGPGILSMANRGKNTGSSQFFITVADTPHLNGRHAIFGKCAPEVPIKISEVAVEQRAGNRPVTDVAINTITILRKAP